MTLCLAIRRFMVKRHASGGTTGRDHFDGSSLTDIQFRMATGAGKLEDDTPVVQDTKTGNGLLKPSKVTHAWRNAVASKGLPPVTFHALRHTHVSVLINAGVDVLTISRRVGHSKASITLDV